jgi:hypothetical protein
MKNYYIAVHLEDKNYLGNLQEIGYWENFFIYEVEDHLISRLNLLNIRVVNLSKEVAYGYKFANPQTERISLTNSGYMYEQLKDRDLEPNPRKPGKYKYYLTEEDFRVGILFAKEILREKVYREYKNLWTYTKDNYSEFYKEYLNNVYKTYNDEDVKSVEKKYPTIVSMHKEYQSKLEEFVRYMYEAEQVVESIKTSADVHGALLYLYNAINSLQETLSNDRETRYVQRTSKS